jgi:3-oxoacyl-[acyl-carrier protein] reductase
MDLGLKGKKALVTGASAGLGEAAATALAAEGVELVINSRSEHRLKSAADRIRQATGVIPIIAVGDLSVESERNLVIKAAGDIDILVSNTGGPPPGAFLDHDPVRFEEAGRLLLDSAINLTRAFLPGMIQRGWGRLIYITSVAVLQPVDTLILSNTYRAGVTGFCKTVSNTYARHGITANCVCPGYTATERLNELAESLAAKTRVSPQQVLDGFAGSSAAKRIGRPDELAALIAFLAGERASYITGASIPVDGGSHKGLL